MGVGGPGPKAVMNILLSVIGYALVAAVVVGIVTLLAWGI